MLSKSVGYVINIVYSNYAVFYNKKNIDNKHRYIMGKMCWYPFTLQKQFIFKRYLKVENIL